MLNARCAYNSQCVTTVDHTLGLDFSLEFSCWLCFYFYKINTHTNMSWITFSSLHSEPFEISPLTYKPFIAASRCKQLRIVPISVLSVLLPWLLLLFMFLILQRERDFIDYRNQSRYQWFISFTYALNKCELVFLFLSFYIEV